MANNEVAPIPVQDPIARPRNPNVPKGEKDPSEGTITLPWVKYFTNNDSIIGAAAVRASSATLLAQSASIGTTSFPNPPVTAGNFRVTYYARVTVPATTSSGLIVTFGFTDLGVTTSFVSPNMTGNTTLTVQSNSWLIYSDAAAPITYATTYASVGATPMQYKLVVVLESL